MTIDVREDDLAASEVQALVAEHMAGMRGHTPPGQVHALAIEGLRAPGITFWSAWLGELRCGCGALKELDARTAFGDYAATAISAFLVRALAR